ncbi:hypothetical protein D3C78_1529100 [compost metagenome]
MSLQTFGSFNILHFAGQDVLHRFKKLLVFVLFRFRWLVRFVCFDTQITTGYGFKFFFFIRHDHLDRKFINIISEVENFIPFIRYKLGLWELFDSVDRLSGCIVDVLLIFWHS